MLASTHAMRVAAIALALTAPIILATAAQAQFRRGVKPYYSESYETRGPVRGYEGYLAPDYYCSYKRFPNRECTTGANGKQRCRVVSWRLEQTCQ
jgi:hypothetical protein